MGSKRQGEGGAVGKYTDKFTQSKFKIFELSKYIQCEENSFAGFFNMHKDLGEIFEMF